MSGSLRVMSFNIRLDTPKDGPRRWPRRREEVAETLCRHRPDILGLQEAQPHQLESLQRRLEGYGWVGVGRDDGWRGGEFNPIFFRCDRFELVQTNTFWLSRTPDLPGSMSWDCKLPRIVTWARLRDRTGPGVLCFANTHLEYEGVRARLEGARMLRRRLPAIAGADPLLLVGDFNCRENSGPYRLLTSPAPSRARGDGRPFLQDARHISKAPHEGPTASTNDEFRILDAPETRIDFLFVTAGVSVLTHRVVDDQFDGFYPSDHLPVVADVRVFSP